MQPPLDSRETRPGTFEKCADYWLAFDSQGNTVVGNAGNAIDEGTDDKLTGPRPVEGGVGGAVSGAAQDAACNYD